MPKKHLEEQNEVDIHSEKAEPQEGGKKDTMVKFPQFHSAKTNAREVEEYVSGLTGEPIKGPFTGSIEIPLRPIGLPEKRSHVVKSTREQIERITGHRSGRSGGGSAGKPSARPTHSKQDRVPFPYSHIGMGKKR
jgi:hypothetical protein